MGGAIYLITGDDELVEMSETEYDSEALLQELLAKYSDLLAGDQVDSDRPRRWLLISREAGIPAEEGGAERWAVDHLFVDQDGIPTLVEVKRSSDTRIRREVVGQMLDYAANAVVYWPLDDIRAKFLARCQAEDQEPEEVLANFVEDGDDPEGLWEKVRTNLQVGKVRMLFVADQIPSELRRIVEFLNTQMDPAEVLAVEVKQYTGEQRRILVPRVLGQTAETQRKKGRGTRWTKERFFAALREARPPDDVALTQELLDYGVSVSGRPIEWGSGKERGSFTARAEVRGERFSLFSVYTNGQFTPNFGWNSGRFEGRTDSLSQKYLPLVNERFSLNFDSTIWEKGWPLADLSILLPDRGQHLKDLVQEYLLDIERLAQEQTID